MSDFVKFVATGYIFQKDKNGNPTKIVEQVRHGGGVVRNTREIMGKIFRQCPQLLPCDAMNVRTYPI